MRQIFTNFAEKGEKSPYAEAVWWIGRADVGIKSRRNGQRKERHTMPHKERCGKADSIGDKIIRKGWKKGRDGIRMFTMVGR